MEESLFCPNCGMLKDNCNCGKFQNKNKDKIPKVYSIKDNCIDNERIE